MALTITVNGTRHRVRASPETPLLYVLRDELALRGPLFGCGLSQCGACAVLLEHTQIRSCVTPVVGVVGKPVTTLEGLPALYAQAHGRASDAELHPLQQTWIDEQVPQCGYCQHGMIIQAADLLYKSTHPTEAQIRQEMNAHLCRCATYSAIIRAIKRASGSASAIIGRHRADGAGRAVVHPIQHHRRRSGHPHRAARDGGQYAPAWYSRRCCSWTSGSARSTC